VIRKRTTLQQSRQKFIAMPPFFTMSGNGTGTNALCSGSERTSASPHTFGKWKVFLGPLERSDWCFRLARGHRALSAPTSMLSCSAGLVEVPESIPGTATRPIAWLGNCFGITRLIDIVSRRRQTCAYSALLTPIIMARTPRWCFRKIFGDDTRAVLSNQI
jgi:hypothetical protein